MKVLKFGGSSVKSADRIKQVAAIIGDFVAKNENVYVVVSAFGGITDQLIDTAKVAEAGDDSYKENLETVRTRHLETAKELLSGESYKLAKDYISQNLNNLNDILQGLFLIRETTPRMMDRISGLGEVLSSFVIYLFLKEKGLDVSHIDSRDFIVTDDTFGAAFVDFEKTDTNLQNVNPNKSAVCIQGGFIASTDKGIMSTLGRGGSDYTAAIMGAALNADEVEIWTDVDGVMTADPRKVKRAFSLNEMTYEEALEMSHFGAKVIHPPTIQPLLEKNIPIRIRNTFHPEFPGTFISNEVDDNQAVKGISSINDIALLNFQGSGLIGVSGMASRLFKVLSTNGINIILITQASSEHSISFAIKPEQSDLALKSIAQEFDVEIKSGIVDIPEIQKNLSVVALVGSQMKKTVGISGKLFKALGNNGINVFAIAQGSSELNISVVVATEDEAKAISVLHQAFFTSDIKTVNIFLVGVGLIGSTLIDQIQKQASYLREKMFLEIRLVAITNSRNMLFDIEGISFEDCIEKLNSDGEKADLTVYFDKMIEMNRANSILVDCTASPAPVAFYQNVLKNSIAIVTPNKIANSGSYEDYALLKSLSKKHNTSFLYETTVGAGLPIISTMEDLLRSGDQILEIEAVLSGSLSFIFNNFNEKNTFLEVVKQAQEKGFTEPDPRIDLSGTDVARKALILAREIGLKVEKSSIEIENILPQSCIDAPDVPSFMSELKKHNAYFTEKRQKAAKHEKVLRMLASISDKSISVSLKEVGPENPFYNLSGSDNMIVFKTNRYNDRPLVVKGPGAGAAVTAAGVFAEIIGIGNQLVN